jgi:hypothetical protein
MVFIVSSVTVYADSDTSYYAGIAGTESAWLATLQLDNGAIADTGADSSGRTKITPYFADFAAMALLESGTKYTENVRKYIQWHFVHLNTAGQDINGLAGTIYDYREYVGTDGKVVKERVYRVRGRKFYDSTDSYAATFLSLLWRYYKATGDREYLMEHRSDIDAVSHAMLSTMNRGLTMARPDYPEKYLMDNAEVYRGARDGARLYAALFPGAARGSRLNASAVKIKSAVEKKMWNKKGHYYYSALEKNGKPAARFRWNRFYMDATAQVFPVINGLVSPGSKRARLIYRSFNRHWSTSKAGNHRWEKMKYPDEYYWGDLVYTAALMGDKGRVRSYMKTYEKKVKKNSHGYPLYSADCARVIMAADIMSGR